jgi:hypothetical protein
MGLDLAELLVMIQEDFSIRIGEEDEDVLFNKLPQESVEEYDARFTVGFLCDWVERQIQKKNEGIDSFSNILPEVSNSVRETLAKQFKISNPAQISTESSLEQLANLSASPLTTKFWRRLRKIRKNDTDELKAIKSYIVSRECIDVVDTAALSCVIVFVLCFSLVVVETLLFFYYTGQFLFAAFVVPIGILFGIRVLVNWVRCGRKSQITVAEIINHIVDKKRDHSVHIDGSPYSREEIEQDVIKIVSDVSGAMFITMDMHIIKDLNLG